MQLRINVLCDCCGAEEPGVMQTDFTGAAPTDTLPDTWVFEGKDLCAVPCQDCQDMPVKDLPKPVL